MAKILLLLRIVHGEKTIHVLIMCALDKRKSTNWTKLFTTWPLSFLFHIKLITVLKWIVFLTSINSHLNRSLSTMRNKKCVVISKMWNALWKVRIAWWTKFDLCYPACRQVVFISPDGNFDMEVNLFSGFRKPLGTFKNVLSTRLWITDSWWKSYSDFQRTKAQGFSSIVIIEISDLT